MPSESVLNAERKAAPFWWYAWLYHKVFGYGIGNRNGGYLLLVKQCFYYAMMSAVVRGITDVRSVKASST